MRTFPRDSFTEGGEAARYCIINEIRQKMALFYCCVCLTVENKKLESSAVFKEWRTKCPSCSVQGRIIHKQRNRQRIFGSG